MRPSTIWYTLKQGIKNIKRNWMFSIASILTMAACIFLVGVFYSLVTNVDNIAQKVEQEVPVTVFFDEGTTEEQMQEVGNLIQARPEVERVEFESAEQAWENFKDKDGYYVFHAGSKFDAEGNILTNGGRVLGVTATGKDLKEARANAYKATEWIHFENKYMRHDIGHAIDEA